jgi:signal transduction histidine kinase/ActR/RegA family two-component response regulator
LDALNRLSKVVSSSLDLESIYQSFAREVKRLIPYDRMEVVVPDDGDAGLRVLKLSIDQPIHRERIASRAERTDIQWMLAQPQPHIESDLAETRQFREDEALLQMTIRSCVRVPLISKGQVIGVLCMASVESCRYGEHELNLLIPLSEQLAMAIENARLYEAAKTATAALKSAQATLIETERLRAMGQMASGVAHDFNNILTGILGQVLLLQTYLGQGAVAPDELRRNLRLLEQAALDGADIVRKIREATRPRGGEIFAPASLNEVVAQVLETTRPRWKDQTEAHGLRVMMALELGNVPPVLGNAAELREALTNLIFNAIDAMPQGGTVTISTSRTPQTEHPEALTLSKGPPDEREWVDLTVSDTGVGMSPSVKARLFEPFFTTKGVQGTGLGLSMVQGIVRRHGGETHITSTEGLGTSVILRLPVAQEAWSEPPAPAPLPQLPSDLRLLVIDDEPLLGETLADLLRLLGQEAVVATSGEAGLAHLEAEHFDLLITDLGMAGMSGWEVARASRARRPELPVIMVTGWGDQLEPAQLAMSGVDVVVAKPYTRHALLEALSQALARVDRCGPESH